MLHRVIRWIVGFVFLALVCSGAAPPAVAQAPIWAALPDAPQTPEIAFNAAPSCTSWAEPRIDCFVVGSDLNVWQISWTGVAWTTWTRLGYPGVGADPFGSISVVSRGANSLDLFVIGDSGALPNLYQRTFADGTWDDWVDLTQSSLNFVFEVACSNQWSSLIDCFIRSSDNHLWQRTWGGSWGSWVDLGAFPNGWALGGLSATPYNGNSTVIYSIGNNGHAYRRFHNGVNWSDWIDDGTPDGTTLRQVSCHSSTIDRIDCAFTDASGRVWYRRWTFAAGWSAFTDASLPPASAISVVINHFAGDVLLVMITGADGRFYRRERLGDANPWSEWSAMGRPRDLYIFVPLLQR